MEASLPLFIITIITMASINAPPHSHSKSWASTHPCAPVDDRTIVAAIELTRPHHPSPPTSIPSTSL
ncbi:hypothetical protein M0R45_025892 [Rubus argutus]|uniref:Secreted protein n=1 Tax=Rubus argutus TaxID=59490 RepID=A0AAW1WZB0_RUBAR